MALPFDCAGNRAIDLAHYVKRAVPNAMVWAPSIAGFDGMTQVNCPAHAAAPACNAWWTDWDVSYIQRTWLEASFPPSLLASLDAQDPSPWDISGTWSSYGQNAAGTMEYPISLFPLLQAKDDVPHTTAIAITHTTLLHEIDTWQLTGSNGSSSACNKTHLAASMVGGQNAFNVSLPAQSVMIFVLTP